MVGDRCMGFHGGGVELFSSEVISSFKEVGCKEAQCVRRLELKKGLNPCWKCLEQGRVGANLQGRANYLYGPAAGVAYSSGWSLGRLQHPLLLVIRHQAVFQVNCSRSGSATHAAVLVLYYCVSLGVIF